jgi:L-asparaginase / beta-aspartyl-peptidase
MHWRLAVHGGAKTIEPGSDDAHRGGCRAALAAGRSVLELGGNALDAVEAAVRLFEDDPTFNAGIGSALNTAGQAEMCAGVMSGLDLSVGAVAIISGVRHPVSVARLVMNEDATLLGAEGARAFAEREGCELRDPNELTIQKQRAALAECDTVGAVALDRNGNLAAATSTGGLTGSLAGRMGDSAIPGCGYYADNHLGAVALSGQGEAIMRLAVAARVVDALLDLGPERALERGLSGLPHLGGDGGGIAIGRSGEIGWWHNSPHFPVATASSEEPAGSVWLGRGQA